MVKKITDSLSERRKAEDILIAKSGMTRGEYISRELKRLGFKEGKDYGETLVLPMGKAS